jgi:sugar/nucleoside kinase (ribokinase family)
MQALFIGHTYIDVTFICSHLPTGDEKTLADDYAVSFGGNAVTAAFCCARLGIVPDLLTTLGDDWLSRMFRDMASKYSIPLHSRKVREASLSFIMPNNGKRAIVRCRDDDHLHPFPTLNLSGCRALHLDGHQPDAALHYAKLCRETGILTSFDGGAVRENTDELLRFVDVAVVSERMCEQMALSPSEMLDYLKGRGCKIGAVTLGERGVVWYDEKGAPREMPALAVPFERVIDTNGVGDIFHGSYVYSWLARPYAPWADHFIFARAASAHSVQHLGIEASLPTLQDVEYTTRMFKEAVRKAG